MESMITFIHRFRKNISIFAVFQTLLVLVLTGILSNSIIKQSFSPSYGLLLEKQTSHDTIWHLALMGSLDRAVTEFKLVPENPVYSGQSLKGYHYFNDLLWVLVHKGTGVSIEILYLFVAPVALSFLFVISSLWLMQTVSENKATKLLGTILLTVGAGLAAFAPLIFKEAVVHQSLFWLDQPTHYIVNQQLLLSLTMVNLVLVLLFKQLHKKAANRSLKKSLKYIGAFSCLLALLAVTKVYAVLILVPAVGLGFGWRWLQGKDRDIFFGWVLGTTAAISLLLLNTGETGWPFIWSPGWFFKSLFESGDRLNAGVWELERQVFAQHNNLPRLIIHWGYAAIVFYIGNFGIKLLGFAFGTWLLARNIISSTHKKSTFFIMTLLFLALGSLTAPALFVQKGVIWNTIQFMHFAQAPLVVLLVLGIERLQIETIWKHSMLVTLILISLPTTLLSVYQQQTVRDYFYASPTTLEKVSSLSALPAETTVIVDKPIANTAVVPAFAHRSVYYTDPIITEILELHTGDRHQNIFEKDDFCPENATKVATTSATFNLSLHPNDYPFEQDTLSKLPVTADQVMITNCEQPSQ